MKDMPVRHLQQGEHPHTQQGIVKPAVGKNGKTVTRQMIIY